MSIADCDQIHPPLTAVQVSKIGDPHTIKPTFIPSAFTQVKMNAFSFSFPTRMTKTPSTDRFQSLTFHRLGNRLLINPDTTLGKRSRDPRRPIGFPRCFELDSHLTIKLAPLSYCGLSGGMPRSPGVIALPSHFQHLCHEGDRVSVRLLRIHQLKPFCCCCLAAKKAAAFPGILFPISPWPTRVEGVHSQPVTVQHQVGHRTPQIGVCVRL